MKRFLCLTLLFCTASQADEARIDLPHAVEDPAYGEILFDYYQQRYFAAMTRTLVALDTHALPTQRQRSRVLLGATYVRYGMPAEAEALFRELLEESVDPELGSRVWLHLADLYYRQRDYPRALSVLDKRVPPVPDALQQNYHALRIRVLMKLGRYEEAASVMEHLDTGDPLNAYLKYNLAVSRINAGQGAAGEPLLRELINLRPGDTEVNAVKDKAILALGLHYLREERLPEARRALGLARLDGPFSHEALLLHAQSWLAGDQPEKAMAPLSRLAERSIQYESVQAARLALPHLYVLAGDQARAEQGYRDAILAYNRHVAYIGGLRQKILQGRWFDELVSEPAWSTAMEPLPPFRPNRVESFATFSPLFATHAFQNTWRDYHEVLRQLRLIETWQHRLPALEDMVEAHERKHQQLVPQAHALVRAVRAQQLDARFSVLRKRLQAAIDNNDIRQFANQDERRLFRVLDEAREHAQRWPERMDPEISEKLEFYAGVLAWEIQQDIVPRQWRRIKQLKENQSLLREHRNYVERVEHAAADESGRLSHYRSEFAALSEALDSLHQRGGQLLARHRRHIESLALTQLSETRGRLGELTALAWDNLGDVYNESLRERGLFNRGPAPDRSNSAPDRPAQ